MTVNSGDSNAPVTVVRAGPVATVTLNRPERFNALSVEMIRALDETLGEIGDEPDIRVIVLAAAGKAFSAGHDLGEMVARPEVGFYRTLFAACTAMMRRLQHLPQPVIARVQGTATAAGCQLVAMCDLAVAAQSARFAVSGINFGLFCATPGVALARNVSRKKAMEMLLTGDFISADQALEYGLVNQVVADQDLDAAVAELAAKISAKPAISIRRGKRLFYDQAEQGIEAAYQLAEQVMADNMMDAEAQEGFRAFLEKRRPDWA
ncbi:enoyl-CoA hydratase [Govanella unica]|uniref:Enoyl-CoA hydratase domain-containing protein 3, mitochondrial n=1 Tax=Govanella unica TaxID=2975056 RepID=A0A9X3Z8A8_9PROT|nr:enoyl-CoA hydratase [Govania unica]MDA5195047.1 enoyl-CoA hydratase [Govania unica]